MCKTVRASGDCVYPIGGVCKQGVFFYFNLFLTLLYSALWDDASGVVTSFGKQGPQSALKGRQRVMQTVNGIPWWVVCCVPMDLVGMAYGKVHATGHWHGVWCGFMA
jgi:hypothetical protein